MASFDDFAERLSIETSVPSGADGAPVLEPEEELSCSYDGVSAHIADGLDLGAGRLVLTTR